MARLILTTVGTSIITKENIRLWDNFKDEIKLIKIGKTPTKYDECVRYIVKNLLRNVNQTLVSNSFLSAELASLCALKKNKKIDKDDVIVLLATDTVDGQFCADINKRVLDSLGWCKKIHGPCVVNGFKTKATHDINIAEEFIKVGLESLKTVVDSYYDPKVYDENYFNITGGFKVIIPIATIIAFERDMNLIYLYEGSNDLIIIEHPSKFYCTLEDIKPYALSGMPNIGG